MKRHFVKRNIYFSVLTKKNVNDCLRVLQLSVSPSETICSLFGNCCCCCCLRCLNIQHDGLIATLGINSILCVCWVSRHRCCCCSYSWVVIDVLRLLLFLYELLWVSLLLFLYKWGLNEADIFKSSSIMIYSCKEQSIYMQSNCHVAMMIKRWILKWWN